MDNDDNRPVLGKPHSAIRNIIRKYIMDNHCQSAPLKFLLVILMWVLSFTLIETATCNDIPQVPHAELELEGQTPPFQLRTAITFDCVSGFVTDLRVRQITCHEDEDGDAVWDELPYACKPKSCGFPGDVKNARRIGNVFTFSNNVTYVCNEGFKLRGTGTLYCMTTGIWRPALPSCEERSSTPERIRSGTTAGELECSHPGPLENGKFLIGNDSVVPHVLYYTCNDGTTGRIKCSKDGTWNTQPKCPGTTVHHLTDDSTKTNSTLKEFSTTPLQITDATTKIPDDQKDAKTTTDHQNTVTMTNTEQYSVTTTNKEHNCVTAANGKCKKVTKSEVESTTENGSGLSNTPSLLCLSFSWLFYYLAKLLFNHFCEYPLHCSRKS